MRVAMLLVALLSGLLASLCSVQVVQADCRRGRAIYGVTTYSAPVSYVSAPYIAPTTYVAPYHQYEIVKAVPVAVAPDYFWSVRDYYRDQLLADAVAYRILTAQGRVPAGGGQPVGVGQGGYGGGAGGVPQAQPQYPRMPGAGNGQGGGQGGGGQGGGAGEQGGQPSSQPGRTLRTEVDPALQEEVTKSCIKCHDGRADRSDLRDLASLPVGLRWEAHGRVASGNMPKGQKELSNEAVILFYKFALAGSEASSRASR